MSTHEASGIVVGLDFGTTFSGVAWSFTSTSNAVDIITTWETDVSRHGDLVKVPSRISYDRSLNVRYWGYRSAEREHADGHRDSQSDLFHCAYFKLGLSDDGKKRANDLRSKLETTYDIYSKLKRQPIDVTADYVQHLWDYVADILREKMTGTFFDQVPIKLVLTTPAIWDHKAQELTRQVISKAGLLKKHVTLEMVSEPEAAAHFVLRNMQLPELTKGKSFIICDAGGGTVDLVSYQIECSNPLRLEMISAPTGGLCGAVFLDRAFHKLIERRLGAAYAELPQRARARIFAEWEESIKQNFRHNWKHRGPIGLDIPAGPFHGNGGARSRSRIEIPNYIEITFDELEQIWQPVCREVCALVQAQVDQVVRDQHRTAPQAVLLVGGLGSSEYLRQELSWRFSDMKIISPQLAWSAIARGAALKGLDDEIVVNQVSRYHYGIEYFELFDPESHDEDEKSWDEARNAWVVDGKMSWYVNKHASISKATPIRKEWVRDIDSPSELKEILQVIYYCGDDVAPSEICSSVKVLCKIKVNFSGVEFDDLPLAFPDRPTRNLKYILEMRITSGSIDWIIEYKGKKIANKLVDVNYTGGRK